MELLTIFLIVVGVISLVMSLLKAEYLHFLAIGDAKKLLDIFGGKVMRMFYAFIGAICLVWGISRVIDPPREIPVVFLHELAKPAGIELVADDALAKLKEAEGILDLKETDDSWAFFEMRLPADHSHFVDARDAAVARSDFRKGFHLGARKLNDRNVEGRIVSFNADYVICDNMLFSKKPLSSTVFVIVICDEATSAQEDGSLVLLFAKKGSPEFETLNAY